MKPFLSFAEPKFTQHKMLIQNGKISFEETQNNLKKGETLVAPCNENFRKLNSIGTKRFKRAAKDKTSFTGCESLELDLVNNGQILHKQKEETRSFEESSGNDLGFDSVPLTQFFKLNFGERLSTTSSAYSDDLLFEDEPSQIGQPKINSAMEFLMAATPKDLKCVALEKLLEAGEFDEYGEAVKATAFLLSKDIKDDFFIKLRFPKYPIADFKKLSARVYQIYRDKKPAIIRQYEAFNKLLTTKQRKALTLVYMDGQAITESAKQLKISVDTLKERIRGGVKKLKGSFPELAKEGEGKSSTNFTCDLLYDGFYRKSLAKKVLPLYRIDPATNERTPISPKGLKQTKKMGK